VSARLGALLAVVIWGASFAATKRAVAELAPATLLFSRAMLGALVVGTLLLRRHALRALPLRDLPTLVALAVPGLVLTQGLQAYALLRSTSANTAWLIALGPVVTAVLAAWLLQERLAGKLLGLGLALGGAILVVTRGNSLATALGLPETRGDVLTLLSTVTWALYTIGGRRFVGRHDARLVTAHLLVVASVAFAPLFVVEQGWRQLAALSPVGWACLGYLGIGCSGIGLLLYYAALEHLEASQVAAFIYLEPLIAQALAIGLLGEPVTASLLAGGGAILIGVYLVTRPRRARVSAAVMAT